MSDLVRRLRPDDDNDIRDLSTRAIAPRVAAGAVVTVVALVTLAFPYGALVASAATVYAMPGAFELLARWMLADVEVDHE
jgi:hypothetical protein